MAFINNYSYEQYSQAFDCPDGENAVRIDKAELTQSKTGKDMLEIRLSVHGSNGQQYIERYVDNDYFNKNMSRFFDAFRIQPGNFDFNSWLGKTAKGFFEHVADTYTDNSGQQKDTIRTRMKYLLTPDNQQKAPQQRQQYSHPQQQKTQYQQRTPQNTAQNQQSSNLYPEFDDIPF